MNDLIRSHSQCGEDILLWRVLQKVVNGFYIDIGAFDPNEDSVTRIFYDAGWSGINIEPNPGKISRFAEERTRDLNLCIAAGNQFREMELSVIGETGLTTLVDNIAEKHQSNGWPIEKIKVEVRPLAQIWDEYIPKGQDVHFMKIDVEGYEEAVIRGADWSRHRPWILVIEALEPNSLKMNHQNWDALLQEAGYEFVNFDGLNRYYVACERPEYIEPLSKPLNFVIDRFLPAGVHQAQNEVARLDTMCNHLQTELSSTKQELSSTKRELSSTKREQSQATQDLYRLLDVMQRRPRPLWEMIIFRRSGKPKKIFRRILFHKSGKPRGIFRNWILKQDQCPRAAFYVWMSGPNYQNLPEAVSASGKMNATPVAISDGAQHVARRVAALRSLLKKE